MGAPPRGNIGEALTTGVALSGGSNKVQRLLQLGLPCLVDRTGVVQRFNKGVSVHYQHPYDLQLGHWRKTASHTRLIAIL